MTFARFWALAHCLTLEFYPDWPVGLDDLCSFSWLDDHDDDEEQLHFFVTAAFVISADKRAERVRISGIGSTFPVSWLYTVLTWYIWLWGYSGKAKGTLCYRKEFGIGCHCVPPNALLRKGNLPRFHFFSLYSWVFFFFFFFTPVS